MCSRTAPFQLDMIHRICGFDDTGLTPLKIISKWNASYNYRAKNYPTVAITEVWNNILFLNNWTKDHLSIPFFIK